MQTGDQITDCVKRCVHEPESLTTKDLVIIALLVTGMISVLWWLSKVLFRRRRRGKPASGTEAEMTTPQTHGEIDDETSGDGKED